MDDHVREIVAQGFNCLEFLVTLDTSPLLAPYNASNDSQPRHFDGANYLAADWHVK
jgi:prepilin-type processing-associated H-X9-DG protein